jgi:hypothetical protein
MILLILGLKLFQIVVYDNYDVFSDLNMFFNIFFEISFYYLMDYLMMKLTLGQSSSIARIVIQYLGNFV